jgi:Tol biopolymer transport system component
MKHILSACLMAYITFVSCDGMKQYSVSSDLPELIPDCSGTVIPCNIAPLNFYIRGNAEKYMARFVAGKDSFDLYSRNRIDIPGKRWKKLLRHALDSHSRGTVTIRLFSKTGANWTKHQDVTLSVVADSIDPFLVYRLIEPGYQYWDKMGIYQRRLESFEETPVMLNTLTDVNCMNCHSFCNNNPQKMLFHLRAEHAGTMLVNNGEIKKINTKTKDNISPAVYPRWHPQGRYIAFSVNKTSQVFHTTDKNLIEVYDSASDLIIYDTEKQHIYTAPSIHSPKRFETFPEWSPDGKSLYFCSAPALKMPDEYDSLKYDLFRTDFDPQTGKIGNKIDTVLPVSQTGKSVAFPRISPDGRHLLICLFDYGTFPIWHKENDLYLMNLQTGDLRPVTEINRPESDSYHSLSSTGKWIVFGSRRMDGLYTRPYNAYSEADGRFGKPFLLPQKNPLFYDDFMKSYNIPEFVTGKITTGIRELERVARK